MVHGPKGSLVVKQALPFIRIVPSASLRSERIAFEHAALGVEHRAAPAHVLNVLGFHAEQVWISNSCYECDAETC
jgi:5-methylthioribose kinase